jgi:hypothetical protein
LQGSILVMTSFFIASFLLFRLLSPWAKTYWKKDLIVALVQAALFAIFLVYLSYINNTNDFSNIINVLGRNTTELNREPGIILSGTAGDPSKNSISVGIGIDNNKITGYRLKQVVESYLSNSAALINEHDWKKLLLPYTLKIEEIGEGDNGKILAEKKSGVSELTWNQ